MKGKITHHTLTYLQEQYERFYYALENISSDKIRGDKLEQEIR